MFVIPIITACAVAILFVTLVFAFTVGIDVLACATGMNATRPKLLITRSLRTVFAFTMQVMLSSLAMVQLPESWQFELAMYPPGGVPLDTILPVDTTLPVPRMMS